MDKDMADTQRMLDFGVYWQMDRWIDEWVDKQRDGWVNESYMNKVQKEK